MNTNNENNWDWIDSSEAMALLHVSYNTILNLVRRGVLPKSSFGRKLYFRRSVIDGILASNMLCADGSIDSSALVHMPQKED